MPANSTRFREATCPPSDSIPHHPTAAWDFWDSVSKRWKWRKRFGESMREVDKNVVLESGPGMSYAWRDVWSKEDWQVPLCCMGATETPTVCVGGGRG